VEALVRAFAGRWSLETGAAFAPLRCNNTVGGDADPVPAVRLRSPVQI